MHTSEFPRACSQSIETSDVSPAGYLSADGGSSFQLTKTEGEGAKKRTRKYRGATEEALEGVCMYNYLSVFF